MSDDGRVGNLLELSMAPSTRIKYRAVWQLWERCCREVDALLLPADPTVLRSFLARVAGDGSKTNYKTAVAAIAWQHSVAGVLFTDQTATDRPNYRGCQETVGSSGRSESGIDW